MAVRHDRFLSRVLWVTVAAITIVNAWQAPSWRERAFIGLGAAPRLVEAPGDLADEGKSTIELLAPRN